MHASAECLRLPSGRCLVLFLIIRCAEDREAFHGFQPFVCYKVIADCPLEVATIIKLQLTSHSSTFSTAYQYGIVAKELS